jgi:hypothetical protein
VKSCSVVEFVNGRVGEWGMVAALGLPHDLRSWVVSLQVLFRGPGLLWIKIETETHKPCNKSWYFLEQRTLSPRTTWQKKIFSPQKHLERLALGLGRSVSHQ